MYTWLGWKHPHIDGLNLVICMWRLWSGLWRCGANSGACSGICRFWYWARPHKLQVSVCSERAGMSDPHLFLQSQNVLWWASRIFRLLTMSFETHFNEKWMFLGLSLSPWWFFNSTWWYNWPLKNWWDQELFLEQMACKSTYHKLSGCSCFMLYWTFCGLSSSLKGIVVMSIDLSLSHGCEWLLKG